MVFVAISVIILVVVLTPESVEGGSYYNRWQGKKLEPTSSSGLANLNSYILSTTASIGASSICVGKCNLDSTCKAAQYQVSTKSCVLYTISPEGSQTAQLGSNADYVTYSVNSATLASVISNVHTIYFTSALSAANNAVCWDYTVGTPTQGEELGVSTDNLHDLAFSSSSTTGPLNTSPFLEPPSFARINNPLLYFCWKQNPVLNEWVKIDLQRYSHVTRFSYESHLNYYYQTLRLDVSFDDIVYKTYKTGLNKYDKLLDGSAANGQIVVIGLHQPLFTRYMKFIGIVETNPSTYHCFKFSVEGCPARCVEPLGVSTWDIETGSITSDGTSNDISYMPGAGRLNWGLYGFHSTSAQLASPSNLIINLFKPMLVKGVQFQGCKVFSTWVSSFRVQYKTPDGWIYLKDHTGSTTFNGNNDANSVATSFFDSGVVNGQYFNVYPLAIGGSSICFKVELLGCKTIPSYLQNLASSKSVTATAHDTNWPTSTQNTALSSATAKRYSRPTHYQNCTHVPVSSSSPDRPVLTINLGSPQTITTVEIATPSIDPAVALNPDGLWLFDILHAGDDTSGNGNHAIIGKTISYGAGPDDRAKGAIRWTSSSQTDTVMVPVNNIGLDMRNGWTALMWIYIDSSTDATGVAPLSFYVNNQRWGFVWVIRGSGSFHNNYVANISSSWWFEDIFVPLNTWLFIGFTIDCKSGVARQIVNGRAANKRYYGCQSGSMPFGHYGMMGWYGNFVGRVSCLQVYRRALDQSEIEQASLCPWLPPAPAMLFPFDCTLGDILGSATFVSYGTPDCDTQRYFPSTSWHFNANSDGLMLTNGPGGPIDLQYSFTILVYVWTTSYNVVFSWYYSPTNLTTSGMWNWMNLAGGNSDIYRFRVSCRGNTASYATDNLYELTSIHMRQSRWMYLGVQYDHPQQTVRLLYEGEVVSSVSVNCPNGLSTDLPYFGIGGFQGFRGSLACLQVYRQALTRKQIHSVKRCPLTSTSAMQAALSLPLDGQLALSQTASRTVTPLTSSPNINWASGFPWTNSYHYTYSVNGATNSYMAINPLPSSWGFVTNPFTIGIMANNNDTSGYNKALITLAGGSLRLWQHPQDGSMTAFYSCSGGNVNETSGAGAFTNNVWTHQLLSIDTTTGSHSMDMYSDGIKVESHSYGWDCDPVDTTALYLGSDTSSYSFRGSLTCLSIFPGAIGQYQAMEIAQCPTPQKLEGHQCESDLLGPGIATITFSSYYTSTANVPFNSYWLASVWSGNASVAGSIACCWQPSSSSTSEWIQADLLEEKQVFSVETQGDPSTGYYVKTFQLKTSQTGLEFTPYLNRATGSTKTFIANTNTGTVIYSFLRPVILARFVRLIPQTWNTGIGLRWTLRGCPNLLCNMELFDADATVDVSSAVSTNNAWRSNIDASFDWAAVNSSDFQPYFQLTFSGLRVVTASVIQSSKASTAWIKKYHLLYSLDAVNWQAYVWAYNGSNVRIFEGPSSGPDSTPLVNTINPPFVALAVRVVIDDYQTQAMGRFGFKGCRYSELEQPLPSFRVRIGSSNPTNAAAADAQTQCGPTIPSPGVPYDKRITIDCQQPITGQYLSIVGEYNGADLTLCQVLAFNNNATNFAYLKTVTASSDITTANALTLTDGSLTVGSVGTASSSMWLRVDLGLVLPVSKVVLVTSTSGWRSYPATFSVASAQICDGVGSLQLNCPGGQVINLLGANYGRTDSTTCGGPVGTCNGVNNAALFTNVANLCQLRRNCTVPHPSTWYSDPCPNIKKYGTFDYMCIDGGDIASKLIVRVGNNGTSLGDNSVCDYHRMYKQAEMVPGSSLAFYCTPPLIGRYVTIEKLSTMLIKFSEILVY